MEKYIKLFFNAADPLANTDPCGEGAGTTEGAEVDSIEKKPQKSPKDRWHLNPPFVMIAVKYSFAF